jgi:hypothetical protein
MLLKNMSKVGVLCEMYRKRLKKTADEMLNFMSPASRIVICLVDYLPVATAL